MNGKTRMDDGAWRMAKSGVVGIERPGCGRRFLTHAAGNCVRTPYRRLQSLVPLIEGENANSGSLVFGCSHVYSPILTYSQIKKYYFFRTAPARFSTHLGYA